MADIVEKVVIKGDSSSAEKAAKKTEESLSGAFFKSAIAVAAFTKAFAVAVDFVKAGIADAAEYERTTLALGAALENTGQNIEGMAGFLERQASGLQNVTGASDEIIRKMQTLAINTGVAAEDTEKFITASYGLANAMGVNVDTAMVGLTKSLQGMSDRTLKLIPEVAALTKEQLLNGEAVDIVAEKFGNFADIQRRGVTGGWVDLTNAFADVREEFVKAALTGGELNDVMRSMASGLAAVATSVSKFGVGGTILGALFDREGLAKGLAFEAELDALNDRIVTKAKAAANVGIDFGGGAGVSPKFKEVLLEIPAQVEGMFAKMRASALNAFDWEPPDQHDFIGPLQTLETLLPERFAALEQTIGDAQAEVHMSNLERRAHIEDLEAARREENAQKHKDNLLAIEKEAADKQKVIMNSGMAVASSATSALVGASLDALEAWSTGAEFSAQQVAASILKGLGRQLIGSGTAHGLEAIARGALSYGLDPTAATLAGVATAEIATGLALFGGSLVLGPSGGGGGGGGGGGTGGPPEVQRTSADFRPDEDEDEPQRGTVGRLAAAASGTTTTGARGGGTAEPVATTRLFGRLGGQPAAGGAPFGGNLTVVFNGPTTSDEVGVAIEKLRVGVRRKGLI